MSNAAAVILAAGKSTRMKSELPKVLHELCGRPMLAYVLDACRDAGIGRLIVVVGYGKDRVIEAFSDRTDCTFVEQAEQKGTAHAVLCCRDALDGFSGQVLVIAGDMPLVSGATATTLLQENARTGDGLTLATTILDDPTGYGRIVRDDQGRLQAIVEHRDCTPEQLAVKEVNPSYYCFDGRLMFDALGRVGNDNAKGEYYITDAVRVLAEDGRGAAAIPALPAEDATGINSRADLAAVNRIMQNRIQAELMDAGVTIIDPASTWIDSGARIGPETIVYPFTHIDRDVSVGAGCRIGPLARLEAGSRLGAGQIVASSAPCAGAQP